ncbi:MAG: hypothetical protein GY862_32520 [Gammaproteobacteria bacterium]|nr:hypothetical protein [Gammaproteobacteria bacterium]
MRNSYTQSGAAMMIILVVLVLSVVGFLSTQLDSNDFKLEQQAKTRRALALAKEALLAYAVTFHEGSPGNFGFLPCPDLNAAPPLSEGVSHGSACGSQYVSQAGRLPWKSLDLPPIRDGSGECLWYALSGHYKSGAGGGRADMLNEDSNGVFEIYASDLSTSPPRIVGNLPQDRAVAVIIAPGKTLVGQNRSFFPGSVADCPDTDKPCICGGNYTASNYLDIDIYQHAGGTAEASDIDNAFVSPDPDVINQIIVARDSNSLINDNILYITREEIFDAVRRRGDFAAKMDELTKALAQCVAKYGNTPTNYPSLPPDLPISFPHPPTVIGRLPWPAPVDLVVDTDYDLSDDADDYRDDDAYDDQNTLLSGRFPNIVNESSADIRAALNDIEAAYTSIGVSLASPPALPPSMLNPVIPDFPNPDKLFCDPLISTDSEMYMLWQNWKDHFFYAVSNAYKPDTTVPATPVGAGPSWPDPWPPSPVCGTDNCLQVAESPHAPCGVNDCTQTNGGTPSFYAAIVMFSGERLSARVRNAPLIDATDPNDDPDDKKNMENYLEENNVFNLLSLSDLPDPLPLPAPFNIFPRPSSDPNKAGNGIYQTSSALAAEPGPFNDILYCIKADTFDVVLCP